IQNNTRHKLASISHGQVGIQSNIGSSESAASVLNLKDDVRVIYNHRIPSASLSSSGTNSAIKVTRIGDEAFRGAKTHNHASNSTSIRSSNNTRNSIGVRSSRTSHRVSNRQLSSISSCDGVKGGLSIPGRPVKILNRGKARRTISVSHCQLRFLGVKR